MSPRKHEDAAVAQYKCQACRRTAAIITLIPPGVPDEGLKPGPAARFTARIGYLLRRFDPQKRAWIWGNRPTPPGLDRFCIDEYRLSIQGGLVPVQFVLTAREPSVVADAVRSGDPKALFDIDPEYTPCWCPKCEACYCRRHWEAWPLFDDGFFDRVEGMCPDGHRRTLAD